MTAEAKKIFITSLGRRTGGKTTRSNLHASFEGAPNANNPEVFRQRMIERGQKPLPRKTAEYIELLKAKGARALAPKNFAEAKARGNITMGRARKP
jgi:hypothetical protein